MKKPEERDESNRPHDEGQRLAQAWEEFFSAAEETGDAPRRPSVDLDQQARLASVRTRHENELLRYPNVVGVAEGIRTRQGKPTGEPCLVVYVERKVPRSELNEGQILPTEIEGVPVDVVEIGRPQPQIP